jgi:hypothetical protein
VPEDWPAVCQIVSGRKGELSRVHKNRIKRAYFSP